MLDVNHGSGKEHRNLIILFMYRVAACKRGNGRVLAFDQRDRPNKLPGPVNYFHPSSLPPPLPGQIRSNGLFEARLNSPFSSLLFLFLFFFISTVLADKQRYLEPEIRKYEYDIYDNYHWGIYGL